MSDRGVDKAASPALELYACMTPNVLKVMLMLGELELDFAINHVRIYRGENFAPGFDALHPYRKLPVLVDHAGPDGKPHRVFESGAILVYLSEKHERLCGDGLAQRSEIMQWLMLQMSSVGPTFGNATHFNKAVQDQPYAKSRFITQAIRLCELYDARLRDVRYLVGENYSIADIATFPWLWRHPTMVGIDADAYPHLQRWIAEIRARPGFQRVFPAYKELVSVDLADMAAADPDAMDHFLGRGRWSLGN